MLDAIDDMLSDEAFKDADLERVSRCSSDNCKEWAKINRVEAVYFEEHNYIEAFAEVF